MDEPRTQKRAERAGAALKLLSVLQVIGGVCLLTAILFLVNGEILELAAEEIMMPGRAVMAVAVILLLLVTASGLVSLYRVRYGWIFAFSVATLVLLMGLLQGIGTILLTKISFLTMMVLSLIVWAGAVVYYLWDLYT